MTFCTFCGTQNPDGTPFCVACGRSLTDQPRPVGGPAPAGAPVPGPDPAGPSPAKGKGQMQRTMFGLAAPAVP
ncbi:MAG: zinc ribbon domain-containing protein, partial [Myxococcales bacterium]|nr:zinc ribbon domain-containing protein [Myxococcales bacterium]